MPRAVPPWLHRVLLRDYGPPDPWIKLVVFTVNAFMDDSGKCFPSQEAIAAAAGMGVSTVRRKIAEANRGHWIAIQARAVYGGRHWKQYSYRACCPDSIDLSAIVANTKTRQTGEDLVDTWEAQHGAISPENLKGTMFPQHGRRRAPPASSGMKVSAPPAPSGTNPPPGAQAPPADFVSTARPHIEHRPLTTQAPPAAAYEVPIRSSNLKLQAEGALGRTDRGRTPKPKDTDDDRARRIERALRMNPTADDNTILSWVSGATLEQVRAARQRHAA